MTKFLGDMRNLESSELLFDKAPSLIVSKVKGLLVYVVNRIIAIKLILLLDCLNLLRFKKYKAIFLYIFSAIIFLGFLFVPSSFLLLLLLFNESLLGRHWLILRIKMSIIRLLILMW